ncbi:NAD(P)H-binding protein [Geomonas sp. Red32]|uniref:NAD(P)H-binding protein n=1 Tax=Geomonas sp. Red32 TaxID=2912856 RepID=UPI00202CF568|nr:NAD(P)H-binding protein [Geomonas sp. Red32]MCM0084532.1 NAD(P)H-binding protein [Geomonas sp. Red32]
MKKSYGSILVTGATGFIGRRLTQRLLESGFSVRCMVRRSAHGVPGDVEIVQGDLLEPETLSEALAGIDTAYYLVHSMAGGRTGFERRDREAAQNFVAAADSAKVRRVIYLGGLGETGDDLSEHLKSRLAVADILKKGTFATTFLRAAVIIGAGGASFEMIRALVEHLPVMITPRWVTTRCQPIAVGDVIDYLAGCLTDERTCGKTFDIGGPDVLTYREMMERFAHIQGKNLYILPVPVLTPKLSSYWVGLITPVPPSVSMPLIEGLKNEVICRDNTIRDLIPLRLKPYDEAVRSALQGE